MRARRLRPGCGDQGLVLNALQALAPTRRPPSRSEKAEEAMHDRRLSPFRRSQRFVPWPLAPTPEDWELAGRSPVNPRAQLLLSTGLRSLGPCQQCLSDPLQTIDQTRGSQSRRAGQDGFGHRFSESRIPDRADSARTSALNKRKDPGGRASLCDGDAPRSIARARRGGTPSKRCSNRQSD